MTIREAIKAIRAIFGDDFDVKEWEVCKFGGTSYDGAESEIRIRLRRKENPAMRHTKPLTPLSCQHRWRIEEAQGPTSEGRCAHCNSSRKFPNYIAAADWVNDWRLGT